MDDNIHQLLEQMRALEDQLAAAMHAKQSTMFFEIRGKRIEFEQSVKAAHRRLKKGIFHWIITYRPQNLITGPIIYGMAIPMVIFDLLITLYQFLCFPIYQINRVKRGDYIVFDRQNLEYLNSIEKFHCTYCAYANGLMAYATEIIARTEMYFCPIKHARKMLGKHAYYNHFLEFGDGEDYEVRLEQFRRGMGRKK
jgi:hypothetical protein